MLQYTVPQQHYHCSDQAANRLARQRVSWSRGKPCQAQRAGPAAAGMVQQRIHSLDSVLEQCTGVLLDQFGVLHDGKVPYPHAAVAVERLAQAGCNIIILSNSSRRSGGTIGKLARMGFKEEWFAGGQLCNQLGFQPDTHPQPFDQDAFVQVLSQAGSSHTGILQHDPPHGGSSSARNVST